MTQYIKYFILIILITFQNNIIRATLSPQDRNSRNKKVPEVKVKSGPQDENVFERNLVEDEPAAKEILIENSAYFKDTSNRLFNGTTLAYVTPWNNHGYDVAKIWAKKFDIISPVWLQIQRKGDNLYELIGTHDIDTGWINDVRKAGHKRLKFFPRIMFDKFNEAHYTKMLSYDSEREAVNKILIKACQDFKFDGFVLEFWMQLANRVDDKILYRLVIDMATALKEKGFNLILVIPPPREEMYDLFSAKHFEKLYPHMYAFSLMTYDFSTIQRPGANAPLHWMKNAVEHIVPESLKNHDIKRKKILMGLNMYGYDYTPDGGSPILGQQFLSLVKNVKKRLILDEHDAENFFEINTPNGRHIVFYPTLFSINERLNLARKLGVGISLWEIGQGLDYFYDLF